MQHSFAIDDHRALSRRDHVLVMHIGGAQHREQREELADLFVVLLLGAFTSGQSCVDELHPAVRAAIEGPESGKSCACQVIQMLDGARQTRVNAQTAGLVDKLGFVDQREHGHGLTPTVRITGAHLNAAHQGRQETNTPQRIRVRGKVTEEGLHMSEALLGSLRHRGHEHGIGPVDRAEKTGVKKELLEIVVALFWGGPEQFAALRAAAHLCAERAAAQSVQVADDVSGHFIDQSGGIG